MFTYIGHGYKKASTPCGSAPRYIRPNAKDIDRIDAGARNPLMAIIACSTAHFDDPSEDSIAEELLRKKGGPVVIIGSTRISHPSRIRCSAKSSSPPFSAAAGRDAGEVLTVAKSKVLPTAGPRIRWRPSVRCSRPRRRPPEGPRAPYVLLGDPAVRAAAAARRNRPRLRRYRRSRRRTLGNHGGQGIADGNVELTLDRERHVILKPTEKVNIKDKALAERVVANYEAANDKVAVRATAVLAGGEGRGEDRHTRADLPAGTYFVKAFSENGTAAALGAKALKVALP